MVEKDWKNLRSGNGKNMNPIQPRCVSHFTYGDYFTLLRSLLSFFNMNWKFNLNFSRSRKKMKTEIQLFKMILMLAHSLLRHNVKTMISNSVWCYLIEFQCFTQSLIQFNWELYDYFSMSEKTKQKRCQNHLDISLMRNSTTEFSGSV